MDFGGIWKFSCFVFWIFCCWVVWSWCLVCFSGMVLIWVRVGLRMFRVGWFLCVVMVVGGVGGWGFVVV